MSKVKIFLSVFLILGLLVSVPLLVGCGGGDGDENGEGGAAEEQQEGDNGEDDADGDDADDADDDDGDADGDDADDDADSDDSSTIADLLRKATGVDGVQYEVVITSYGDTTGSQSSKWWMEGDNARSESDVAGITNVMLIDYSESVWHSWVVGGSEAYKYTIDTSVEDGLESQADDSILQYTPTIVGTDTIDGKTCTVIQYTIPEVNQTLKIWVWNDYGFTLRAEVREAGELTTVMEWKNVEIGDIDDDMFEVPGGMTIIDMTSFIP